MAELTKQQLDDVKKLVAVAGEQFLKGQQALAEIERVIGGGRRQADLLKDAEGTFATLWGTRYAGGQDRRYVWAYQKDRPQMVRLIKMLGLEELQARMRRYIANDDPFFAKSRHSFGLFVSTVNQHAASAESPAEWSLAGESGGVVGCTHSPRCQSDAEHTRKRRAG
jgi:hypothetical protein